MGMNAEQYLNVALGGNMNISTLKLKAWYEIMEDYAQHKTVESKEQLEKAKCCGSCKWWDYLGPYTPFCSYKDDTPPRLAKYTCESWELIE